MTGFAWFYFWEKRAICFWEKKDYEVLQLQPSEKSLLDLGRFLEEDQHDIRLLPRWSPERKAAQPFSTPSAAWLARKIHHIPLDFANSPTKTPHGGAGAAVPPVEPERRLPPRALLHHSRAAPPLLDPPPPRRLLRGRLQGHAQGDGLLGTRGMGSAQDLWALCTSLVGRMNMWVRWFSAGVVQNWVQAQGFRPGQAMMLWKCLYGNNVWAHCHDELTGKLFLPPHS